MKLLITGAWRDARKYLASLAKAGHDTLFLQNESNELPCEYGWAEGVICNGLFISHPIERFSNLRYIQLTSAGTDRVPMEYVQAQNIEIHNARGVYSIPMAEFAVCAVLQFYKQTAFFHENQKTHGWEKHRGLRELSGKTVCIVGCGSVGTECAKRFAAFDCTVTGVDIQPYENKRFSKMFPLTELDSALVTADIVILTMPLTAQSYHLMNAERLHSMKRDAVLVNISRGNVIDTDALIETLHDHPSFGAALDVFEEEPLAVNSPLWTLSNAIVTPHNSFVGEKNAERLWAVIQNNLIKDGNVNGTKRT